MKEIEVIDLKKQITDAEARRKQQQVKLIADTGQYYHIHCCALSVIPDPGISLHFELPKSSDQRGY